MRYGIFLTLLFLIGCTANKKDYIIEFDQVDHLRAGNSVILNGMEVGEVTDINLGENHEVLVTVQIDNEVSIPMDSKFILSSDFLGNKSIQIEPGTRSENLNPGSHIMGTHAKTNMDTSTSPLTKIITGIFNNKSTKQDSILIELRRLNENLEKLMDSSK